MSETRATPRTPAPEPPAYVPEPPDPADVTMTEALTDMAAFVASGAIEDAFAAAEAL